MEQTIKELFEEDQADRERYPSPTSDELKWVGDRDVLRKATAQKMLDENLLTKPEDYYYAAFIFQHGNTAEDYLKAHQFAQKALEMGYEKAGWIYAATLDRYLINTGKPQKYGTQYTNNEAGELILAPVDPETSDEERLKYGVKPLAQIPKKWPG